MRFIGASNYDHGTKPKIGVLLTNLGTPEAPTAKALRPYLSNSCGIPVSSKYPAYFGG